ncbi:MAG: hypothetical protein IPM18_14900 [Phycisphaerales bacterium]|nr:hypothetical protein [Phycisphaerales bacterium]
MAHRAAVGKASMGRAGVLAFEACRWVLALVFVFSAVAKLSDLHGFEQALRTMGFFERAWLPLLAWLVPVGELVVATLIVFPRTAIVGGLLYAFSSAVFAGLHGYLYANGMIVPCGCFGVSERAVTAGAHLWMLLLCVALFSVAALFTYAAAAPSRRRLPQPDRRPRANLLSA